MEDEKGSKNVEVQKQEEVLHSLVKTEAEEALSRAEGSNGPVAPYAAELANEQANVHVAEHGQRVCATNYERNQWWRGFLQGVEARSHICKRKKHSRATSQKLDFSC